MPTYVRPTEPREEVTDAEASAGFFTFLAVVAGLLTAFFVYMATGNYWWAAATFMGLATLACISFAAANVVAVPGEKFTRQVQKSQQPGFAFFVPPDQPPGPEEPPPPV